MRTQPPELEATPVTTTGGSWWSTAIIHAAQRVWKRWSPKPPDPKVLWLESQVQAQRARAAGGLEESSHLKLSWLLPREDSGYCSIARLPGRHHCNAITNVCARTRERERKSFGNMDVV